MAAYKVYYCPSCNYYIETRRKLLVTCQICKEKSLQLVSPEKREALGFDPLPKGSLGVDCSTCGKELTPEDDPKAVHNKTRTGLIYTCHKCRTRKTNANSYKISLEDQEKMLRAQDGKCAICGRDITGVVDLGKGKRKVKAHIDHSHRTGKIRGLLCASCNLGLGCFKDNPRIITAALKYLAKAKTWRQ